MFSLKEEDNIKKSLSRNEPEKEKYTENKR